VTGRVATVMLLVALLGCAHPVERHDWTGYTGPGAELFAAPELETPRAADPLEPLNRSLAAVNHVLMIGAVAPVSRVYRLLVPKILRVHIQNFGTNILFPRRLVANLLQGRFEAARDETYRFAINSTLGVGGLFDAASLWEIESHEEDFGRTFARWGWRRSTYLVLPGFGPSTIRDAIGLIPDSALNPASYFFPAGPILTLNEEADFVEFYKKFTSTTYDPYHLTRLLWSIHRDDREADFAVEPEDTAQVQTLRAVFLSYKDPRYPEYMRTGWVTVPSTAHRLPYSYRMQDRPAPILFVVPGLGAHRLGDSSLALTEMAWDRGFSVVSISSSMNFEFMERAATTALPGHAPVDSRDVHVALDAIYRQLTSKYPGRITARALMGYSLGGFHTLFIAASEKRDGGQLISFDRYVSLDSPVNLLRGMKKLDAFFNAPLAFPEDERDARVNAILRKTLDLAGESLTPTNDALQSDDFSRIQTMRFGEGNLAPAGPLPFCNLEAEYLIGLNFRLLRQDVLYCSQQRQDQGVLETPRGWFTRAPAYDEIADYSFSEYMFGFVLPYYRDRLQVLARAEDLIAANDLHAVADALRSNGRIRTFANSNDFLTSEADVAWLTELLGEANVRFYERGGHLGGLYRPEVQAEVMAALMDLLTP